MQLKALSNYGDLDTRYGDCILLYNTWQLIVYDCGHEKHADTVGDFLKKHPAVSEVYIVVSHNDADHTNGVIRLLDYLAENGYDATVYTSLYLKSADEIEKLLDDGRRNKKSICDHILDIFDRIAEIVNKAEEYEFSVMNAKKGTQVASAEIVGPLEAEFIEVVAKAIEEDGTGTIDGETIMNAASIQLSFTLDGNRDTKGLLCGDAAPKYMKNLYKYGLIQFPHHGQYKDGVSILKSLGNLADDKSFLISDNTGSGETSGGSEELVEYMKNEKYKPAFNTQNGTISLPEKMQKSNGSNSKVVGLGDIFSEYKQGYFWHK